MSKKCPPQVIIRAFNQTARDYLDSKNEKYLEEINKSLAPILQITLPEVWDINCREVTTAILSSAQLIHCLDHKQNVVWSLVKLLTQICHHVEAKILVEKFRLLPVLVRLLHSLPATTHNRTAKLLELLLILAQDYQALIVDAHLITLAQDLLTLMTAADHRSQVVSATILSSLLRENVLMVKMVLTHCDIQQHLDNLRSLQDPEISLILETIEMRLNQPNLTMPATSPAVVAKILARTVSVVDLAYKNEDVVMIKFYSNYIQDLAKDERIFEGMKTVDTTDSLAKLLAVANFRKGSPQLWNMYFNFCTTFIQASPGDKIVTFNTVFKIVLDRLEVKPYKEARSSLELLSTCLGSLAQEELTQADRKNLKFQMDQILPGVGNMLSTPGTSCKEMEFSLQCLLLLNLLQGVEPVSQASLAALLPADRIHQAFAKEFRSCRDNSRLKCRLGLHFVRLAGSFAGSSDSWRVVRSKVEEEDEVMGAVASGLRNDLFEDEAEVSEALGLVASRPSSLLASSCVGAKVEAKKVGGEGDNSDGDGKLLWTYLASEDKSRLDQCLEEVRTAASRLTVSSDDPTKVEVEVDRILPGILSLQTFIGHEERAEVRSLRAALAAADERLQQAAWQHRHLAAQNDSLRSLVGTVAARDAAARQQLAVIRSQHNSTSKMSQSQIQFLKDTLEDTESSLAEEKRLGEEAREANTRMKHDLAKMTSELESLIKDRESQEEHLREAKAALSKRDDKLKKTIKQLDESQSRLEEIQKKTEKLEKMNKSLDSLAKNQEEVILKKEKQLEDTLKEVEELKKIRDAIFNLSKTSAGSC